MLSRLRSEMKIVCRPLAGKSGRAAAYAAAALALMLLYLQFGHRLFFVSRLGPLWWPELAAEQSLLWGAVYQFAAAFFFFFAVPFLALLLLKERPLRLGLELGDWRAGVAVVVLGILLVALPGGYSAGAMTEFRAEYPLGREAAAGWPAFLFYQLAYGFLYYLAWESFFRGFLQIGLAEHAGAPAALIFQTAASTLLHIGKPVAEIWAALAAGFAFGLLALRLRSVWPLVIIHWALGFFTDFFCARALGWL